MISERKKESNHKLGEGHEKRLNCTTTSTHLGILVATIAVKDKDLISLRQLYSGNPNNVADGEALMQDRFLKLEGKLLGK